MKTDVLRNHSEKFELNVSLKLIVDYWGNFEGDSLSSSSLSRDTQVCELLHEALHDLMVGQVGTSLA